ncbi:DUF805 domain-containing protein [Shewanella mesophila]|uniref:DUF805 domain-containing protein n=1 Tax=Shewanella mesophila TaxID=2864208 RepID=UPI001C65ECE3|nr:DUF805 domain-containing protein [Shewanella mesophila]QYJ85871.1 DUF805 domain-containing protein [Shewanella mesophila]
MQLNTFFCRRGVDSNLRFGLINLVGFLSVWLFFVLFSGHSIGILVALGAAVILILSALRRANGQLVPLLLVPALGLLLFSIGLVYELPILSGVSVVTSVISVAVIALRPLPNAGRHFDAFGYSGPLVATRVSRRRVEPTLTPNGEVSLDSFDGAGHEPFEHAHSAESSFESERSHDVGMKDDANLNGSLTETLAVIASGISKAVSHLLAVAKRYPKVVGSTFAASMLVLIAVSMLWPAAEKEDVTAEQEAPIEPQSEVNSDIKTVVMPDGFNVLLEGDVLQLSWLGERGEPGLIWSLATAKGDKSCQNLTFNNDAQYRPIEVRLTATTATVARFSPLDTRAILNDIAMRGSLKLCGYQFSLKGSQAALAKEPAFRPYL